MLVNKVMGMVTTHVLLTEHAPIVKNGTLHGPSNQILSESPNSVFEASIEPLYHKNRWRGYIKVKSLVSVELHSIMDFLTSLVRASMMVSQCISSTCWIINEASLKKP